MKILNVINLNDEDCEYLKRFCSFNMLFYKGTIGIGTMQKVVNLQGVMYTLWKRIHLNADFRWLKTKHKRSEG